MGIFQNIFGKFVSSPSQHKFAKLIQSRICRAGESGKIVYDPKQFCLFVDGEDGHRLFLNNVYAEYCSIPKAEREATLKRIIRTWFAAGKDIPDDFEDARHDLLPVVRSRGYFDSASMLMQIEGNTFNQIPYQPISDDLAVALVYDLPESMRSIVQKDLDKWNITFYEALEAAKEELGHLSHAFVGPKEGEGVYLSMSHDNYDASRLLLLNMVRQMQVKGDFVAMVPNRDSLIVTGSDDEDGLKGMLALAKDALQQPRPISGLALRLDGDEWVSWMPDATHPLYQEFRLLQVQSIGQDYSEQKDLLDKLHAKNNEDIFTASYMVMDNKETGHLTTFSVWSKDVPTLLPRTDRIAFVQDGRDSLMAEWDRAVEIMGDSITPLDIYPQRFRVSEFPTEDQLTAMGATTP